MRNATTLAAIMLLCAPAWAQTAPDASQSRDVPAPASGTGPGPAISTFRVTQVFVDLPEVSAWVDVRNSAGNAVGGLERHGFRGAVEGEPMQLAEMTPPPSGAGGTAYVLLIDCSRTMEGPPFASATAAARQLVGQIGPKDLMAIVRFGDDVKVVSDFVSDRDRLNAALVGLKATDGSTRLFLAVRRADEMLRRSGQGFPRRKAILMVTDGKDEGSGITIDDLLNPARQMDFPILAVGFSKRKPWTFDNLNRLAAVSGGAFVESPTPAGIEKAYSDLVTRLSHVYLVRFDWRGRADGARKTVQVTYQSASGVFTDNRTAVMVSSLPPPPEPTGPEPVAEPVPDGGAIGTGPPMQFLLLAGGGLVAVVLIVLLVLRARRKPEAVATAGADVARIEGREALPVQPLTATRAKPAVARITLLLVRGDGRLDPPGPAFDVPASGLLIGRAGDVKVQGDPEVSGSHCKITWASPSFLVEDPGSRNGLLRNGARVAGRERLEDGDVLEMGRTCVRVRLGGEAR